MNSSSSKQVIRRDIQALRCIAVLAVIGYHANLGITSGGFIGVDIFFVISGYLITTMLLTEMRNSGKINLVQFWARRIRRLLPAATIVLCVTASLSKLFQSPLLSRTSLTDSIWASFYSGNIRFGIAQQDYFHSDQPSPVMHFWSLAVEEQFYLLFPILIFALFGASLIFDKSSTKVFAVAFTITAISSLVVMNFYTTTASTWAFYGVFSRVWEFAIGAIGAITPVISIKGSNRANWDYRKFSLQFLSLICWLIILLSIFRLSPQASLPNLPMELAVGSTAILLWLGLNSDLYGTRFRRIFHLGTIQSVGNVSYSLYLWHWPVLLFGPLIIFNSRSGVHSISVARIGVLVLISLCLAYLTNKFIENPIRYSRGLAKNAAISMIFGLTLSMFSAGWASALVRINTYEISSKPLISTKHANAATEYNRDLFKYTVNRLAPKALPVDHKFTDRTAFFTSPAIAQPSDGDGCFTPRAKSVNVSKACIYGSRAKARVVLFGDSFANMWTSALMPSPGKSEYGLEVQTRGVCSPLLFPIYDRKLGYRNKVCENWRNLVIKRLRANPPAIIFLATERASIYSVARADGKLETNRRAATASKALGLHDLLMQLPSASKVVWIRSTPRMPFDVPTCVTTHTPLACQVPTVSTLDPTNFDIKILKKFPKISMLDLTNAICSPSICGSIRNNTVIFRDRGHITGAYSKKLGPIFRQIVNLLKASLHPRPS